MVDYYAVLEVPSDASQEVIKKSYRALVKKYHPDVTTFDKKYIEAVLGSFVSLWIPMSVVKEVGLPIKEFFIWGDDWEYTRRISI